MRALGGVASRSMLVLALISAIVGLNTPGEAVAEERGPPEMVTVSQMDQIFDVVLGGHYVVPEVSDEASVPVVQTQNLLTDQHLGAVEVAQVVWRSRPATNFGERFSSDGILIFGGG